MVSEKAIAEGLDDAIVVTEEVRLDVAQVSVSLAEIEVAKPVERRVRTGCFVFDLALTQRPNAASAGFPTVWGNNRHERLGSLVVLPPELPIDLRVEAGSYTSVIARLDPALVNPWLPAEMSWSEPRLESCLNIPDRRLRSLLLRTISEIRQPRAGSEQLIALIGAQIGIEFSRHVDRIERGPVKGGLAAWRKRLIEDRVRKPGKAPTIDELAAACELSTRQLARAFEKSYTCSVGRYIDETRIELAKQLLLTSHSIGAVADTLGYSGHQNFSQAFRRLTGITPTQFRNVTLHANAAD